MKYKPNPNTKCTCSNSKHHAFWVLNEKGIVKSIENVLKTGDIEKLTKDAYDFVLNLSGFIAHYSYAGFKDYYQNVADFRNDLEESADTHDYIRYIRDPHFGVGEQKEYYAQKAKILEQIATLCANEALKGEIKSREENTIKDKVAFLKECVKRAEEDVDFGRQILKKLELI